MTLRRVYLDNSATTPVDRRVVEAMMPFLCDKFGNAASVHFFGQEARSASDRARRQVAELINARPNEIVMLSGGTEANNLAIRGIADSQAEFGRHVITSVIEHSAVRNVCDHLEQQGWEVTHLPVHAEGVVRVEDVRAALRPDTVLISVMLANNEIGTIQPAAEIGQLVREERARGHKHLWFHTDGVQALGRMKVDVEAIGCDMLSMSGHKVHAPKGVGALYVRRSVRLAPQNIGGTQERQRRGGTEAVELIVAFGQAAELARLELDSRVEHMRRLRDRFEAGVLERVPDSHVNGDRDRRLPHITNISFRYVEGEGLLINLDMQGVAISTGSACSSGSIEVSPVIRALGLEDELGRGSARFSLGKDTTDEDIDYVLEVLPRCVENLRRLSPLYQKAEAERAACPANTTAPALTPGG